MKVTFNRGDMGSAIKAAQRLEADHTLYIIPTVNGLSIEHTQPPTWIRHVEVRPNGSIK